MLYIPDCQVYSSLNNVVVCRMLVNRWSSTTVVTCLICSTRTQRDGPTHFRYSIRILIALLEYFKCINFLENVNDSRTLLGDHLLLKFPCIFLCGKDYLVISQVITLIIYSWLDIMDLKLLLSSTPSFGIQPIHVFLIGIVCNV